jgi:Cu+-exporting ATPase
MEPGTNAGPCGCDPCSCGPDCQCPSCACQTSAVIEMDGLMKCTSSSSSPQQSPPPIQTVELAIAGMTCSMCSDAVKRGLTAVDGVVSVSVTLATNLARIEYVESENCNPDTLQEEVEDIGYDVTDVILPQTTRSEQPFSDKKTVELTVGGMTCSMCSSAVQQALIAVPGVVVASVTLSTNIARIEYTESEDCNPEILQETVEDIGYDVTDAIVVPTAGSSRTFSETMDDEPDDRLNRILKQQEAQLQARQRDFLWCLLGTLPIVSITMVLPKALEPDCDVMNFLKGSIQILGHSFIKESLILWILATFVQFGCGFSLYKTSYYGISRGVYGMDVLVTLGMTASYFYAVMATWENEAGYRFFETSAVLLCFVLLGKWMNAMAVCRTSDALTSLMKLQAKTALRVIPCQNPANQHHWNPLIDAYKEETVPIQHIQPGDIVKILKGASIPADGELAHGEMCVDESMITGESIPVLKTLGSTVLGGTICTETGSQTNGSLTAGAFVRVTGVGSATALAQIVQLVQDAQSRQVPIQNVADKISSIFVPSVVTISFLTFLGWYACCKGGVVPPSWYEGESAATFSLLFGIACLVISCPCALGLATPTAVMVGTGVGARHGVLMKGGETLEVAGKVDALIFDKTGTLTRGKPAVTDWTTVVPDEALRDTAESLGMEVDQALLWLVGSLERNSEHPLAAAIVSYSEEHLEDLLDTKNFAQPSNFVAMTGRGASGTIHGKITVAAGNRTFAERENLQVSKEVEQLLQDLESEGKTAILVGINGTVCAVLGVADELKEEARASVVYLENNGVDVWMVTGDSKRTADAIARKLNLSPGRVISEALPASKVEHVRWLQSQGLKVAMVGDGVNDSPALAEADVGMSIGTGAEIATEASDMILVSGKVSDVCTALDLSRVIFRRIQWNLLFSMVYNLLSIPIAAGLLFPLFHTRLPPTVAAIAMALSSVSVVCSSLALRWYKPPDVMALQSSAPRRRRRRLPNMLLRQSEEYDLVLQAESDTSERPVAEIV